MVGWRLAGLFSVVVAVTLSATSCVAGPLVVTKGYDLSSTVSATLGTDTYLGVPLQTFTFPNPIGVQPVGTTDTIIERTADLSFNGTPNQQLTTAIKVTAINLKHSSLPLYATTDGNGTGMMNITYNGATGGTWTNQFTFNIQLRAGSPTGTVQTTISKTFFGIGTWSSTPYPNTLILPGVNDGAFFLTGVALHDAGNGQHGVVSTPEPSTWILGALGAVGVVLASRRRAVAR